MRVSEIQALLTGVVENPALEARLFRDYNPKADLETVQSWVARRQKAEPLSRIIGRRGFYKKDFKISPAVLDPRPDSETVVEAVLKLYPNRSQRLRFLDIGTGSACLLVSLIDEYKNATGVGADKSGEALKVAAENAKKRPIALLERDMFADDFPIGLGTFDVIVSNPPYIPSADIPLLEDAVRLYDPLMSLDGGLDGLSFYRALALKTPFLLREKGIIVVEIGQGQGDDVVSLFKAGVFQLAGRYNDLAGIERALAFQWPMSDF